MGLTASTDASSSTKKTKLDYLGDRYPFGDAELMRLARCHAYLRRRRRRTPRSSKSFLSDLAVASSSSFDDDDDNAAGSNNEKWMSRQTAATALSIIPH